MKNIEAALQIKDGMAVISAEDLAVLLGRKHLSVMRAIDAIPAEHLRKSMFLMAGTEVFLTQTGICMAGMSSRHLYIKRRIMMALSIFDAEYREARWAEFHAAKPPRIVIKLLIRLDDVGLHMLALRIFSAFWWFKNYDPSKTLSIPKSAQ